MVATMPKRSISGWAQWCPPRRHTPRAPSVPPYPGFAGPFFLYQVIDATPPANPSVDYSIVMAAADLAELQGRDVDSDVLLYCTFISQPGTPEEQVRHLAGIRFRGETARDVDPKSYRIDFPAEKTFNGIEHLNLNAINIENELLATDLFRRAGVPDHVKSLLLAALEITDELFRARDERSRETADVGARLDAIQSLLDRANARAGS